MIKGIKKLLSGVLLLSFLINIIVISVPEAVFAAEKPTRETTIIDVTDFGAVPDSGEDAVMAVQQAIKAASKVEGPAILNFPHGRYDFYPDNAAKEIYYISNTASESENPDVTKTIGLLFKGMNNLTVEGNGSLFMFHGKMTMIVVDQCQNITFQNLETDFERPTMSEFRVEEVGSNYLIANINEDSDYKIENNKLIWIGEGWTSNGNHAVEYDPVEDKLWRTGWNPVTSATSVEELEPYRVKFYYGSKPIATVGHVYQLRETIRDQVGVFIHESSNILWENAKMHYMHGLGFVGQYSEDLTFESIDCSPRPETGRTNACFADFMQFSGCRGKIRVLNCNFVGAHDDPINIHGTHLRIVDKPASDQIKVRFMHGQSYGFDAFFPGDVIDFVKSDTLTVYSTNTVKSVARLSNREFLLTLEEPAPDNISSGDVVENATWTPEVEIIGNYFSRIPTRGLLVTTRRSVLIENNTFNKTGMSGILIADDARSWYESGMVRDVTIRGNKFIKCGGPVIYILPENSVVNYEDPVHKNVRVIDNEFVMLDNMVLYAKSLQGMEFKDNRIIRANTIGNNSTTAIELLACSDVKITGNTFEGQGVNRNMILRQMSGESVYVDPSQEINVTVTDELKEVILALFVPQDKMTAEATSYSTFSGDVPDNAIDGNLSTIWHTSWNPYDPLPQSITLYLGSIYKVDSLWYSPRKDGTNGNIKRYRIYASTDGNQFNEIYSGSWSGDSSMKIADFPAVDASHIKLEVLEGEGGWASAAEINIGYQADNIKTGDDIQLGFRGIAPNGQLLDLSNAKISYINDNENVASVDEDGRVLIVGEGTAKIRAAVTLYGKTVYSNELTIKTKENISSVLEGPDEIKTGSLFILIFGLKAASDVMAQDITVTYDADNFEYVEAEPASDGISIATADQRVPGTVRIVAVSTGLDNAVNGNKDILKLAFRPKKDFVSDIISVSKVQVSNSEGAVFDVKPAQKTVCLLSSLEGDLNGDGLVTIGDLGIAAWYYGCSNDHPEWETAGKADINGDNKVDLIDLVYIARKVFTFNK